jgi:hypothetical protein
MQDAPPTIDAIVPSSGPVGRTSVEVEGSHFLNGATVKVFRDDAPFARTLSQSSIRVLVPAQDAGRLLAIQVTNEDGSTATLEDAFFVDYADVDSIHPFHDFVEKIARARVTGGCGDGVFCPQALLTRAQIAPLLLKAMHGSEFSPPPCAGAFLDVPCPSLFADWIERCAEEGLTAGCGGGLYCPDHPITRAQIAVLLLKAEHGAAFTPPPCAGLFGDVACPSLFADWIEAFHAEGVTGGCQPSPLLYCPNAATTRGQAAVFFVKALLP